MLYTPVNQFNWAANNYSNLWPGNAAANTLTAHANAHTKGTDTACMVGVAEDVYDIAMTVTTGSTDATIRRQMIDLLIDPAAGVGNAGSSWSVAINNLYCNSPSIGASVAMWGVKYSFPLHLKAGAAIGARVQDVVGGGCCRFSINVRGKPTHPELLKVGTKVQTIGATTATTTGVAVTPGNAVVGAYSASLGTLDRSAWWWQLGIGTNDTSLSTTVLYFDVAEDVTAKYICAEKILFTTTTTELSSKSAYGECLPIRVAAAGQAVYVRGMCIGAPDSFYTAVVYAMGS